MHKQFAIFAVTAAVLGAQPELSAAPVEWSIGAGGNGHFYDVVVPNSVITWSAANSAAIGAGGWLATLTSAAEDQFVFQLATALPNAWRLDGSGNGRGPWIGGLQPPGSAEPAGGWQWVNGEGAFVFTNWEAQQPNNTAGVEDRVQFFGRQTLIGDTWNDAADSNPQSSYVVEFASNPVPLPGPLWLLGSATVAMLSRKRSAARA